MRSANMKIVISVVTTYFNFTQFVSSIVVMTTRP